MPSHTADGPISTAARRICRDVNQNVAAITRYYDADGIYLRGHETGMHYANPADRPTDAAVQAAGRRDTADRMTEREAQDLLDAYAATGRYDGAEHGTFLHDIEFERSCARERASFDT
ncbi:hypothetical protein [Amycolatopsis sp. NPDC051102]|uniref:hypothetical protein n=1 Tax=Amycolatopsis sp. NPDC051102 TaxID=3155163 RepID=UPI003447402C